VTALALWSFAVVVIGWVFHRVMRASKREEARREVAYRIAVLALVDRAGRTTGEDSEEARCARLCLMAYKGRALMGRGSPVENVTASMLAPVLGEWVAERYGRCAPRRLS
jgi:hypothetical protein